MAHPAKPSPLFRTYLSPETQETLATLCLLKKALPMPILEDQVRHRM